MTNFQLDISDFLYEDINGLLGLDIMMEAGFIIDSKEWKCIDEAIFYSFSFNASSTDFSNPFFISSVKDLNTLEIVCIASKEY